MVSRHRENNVSQIIQVAVIKKSRKILYSREFLHEGWYARQDSNL